jgi:hypothetical protein
MAKVLLEANDKIVGRPLRLNRQKLDVKKGKDYAEMIFFGDLHLGSQQLDRQRAIDMLQYCLHKGIYVMLMGDLCEAATRNSVGAGVYDQESVAQEQYETMIEWLRPLARKGLLLGIYQGNHEERTYKESVVNITKAMSRELDIPYLGGAAWTQVAVGKEHYTIYALHGRTNARYEGTALLAAERCSVSFNCDIFAMAHTHRLIHDVFIRERIVDGQVKEFKQYVILTGSYLKYHSKSGDSYSENYGMQIPKLGSPKVKLFASRHDIFVSV